MKPQNGSQIRRAFSIAQKIWFSLGILVLGYLFSMVLGFILGTRTEFRLVGVSEYLFPASQQSQKALTAFNAQITLYSDAVSLGELSLIESASTKTDEIKGLLQYILDLKGLEGRIHDEIQDTMSLLKDFTSSAQGVYTKMSLEDIEEGMDESLVKKAGELAHLTEEIRWHRTGSYDLQTACAINEWRDVGRERAWQGNHLSLYGPFWVKPKKGYR
jgi:hypothetical protein